MVNLEEIFQAEVDSMMADPDKAGLIGQVSDLAKAKFLGVMNEARSNPRFEELAPTEAPTYARYLLLDMSLQFAKI